MAVVNRTFIPAVSKRHEDETQVIETFYTSIKLALAATAIISALGFALIGVTPLTVSFVAALPVVILFSLVLMRMQCVKAAVYVLSIGWIAALLLPQLVTSHASPSIAAALLAIPYAAVMIDGRASRIVAAVHVAMTLIVTAYALMIGGTDNELLSIKTSMVGFPPLAFGIYALVNALLEGRLVVRNRLDLSEKALLAKNLALETEVAERQRVQAQQSALMTSLESILSTSETLLGAPTMDAFWHTVATTATEKFGCERLHFYIYDETERAFKGVYATDLRGEIVDSTRSFWQPRNRAEIETQLFGSGQAARWLLDEQFGVIDFVDGKTVQQDRKCWSVCTPLRARCGALLGVMLNDSAISGAPLDATRQDVLCVYASMVANVAQSKFLEQELHTANDVLENRVAERTQLLSESEFKFRTLVQTSENISLILNLNGTIEYISPGVTRVTGFTPEEAITRGIEQGVHEEDIPRVTALLAQAAAMNDSSRSAGFRFRVLRKDNSTAVIELLSVALLEGATKVFITAHDVTDSLRAADSAAHQMALDKLVSQMSTSFLESTDDGLDQSITNALKLVGEFMSADYCRVFLHTEDGTALSNTHEWHRENMASQQHLLQQMPFADKWDTWVDTLVKSGVIQINDMRLPPSDHALTVNHQELIGRDVGALLDVPILINGVPVGSIGVDMMNTAREWTAEDQLLIKLSSGLISSALGRSRAVQMLRRERDQLEARVRERTSELNKVLEVSNGLTAKTDRNSVLEMILLRMREITGCASASISALGENGEMTVLARLQNDPFEAVKKWQVDPSASQEWGDLYAKHIPVVIDDTQADTETSIDLRAWCVENIGSMPVTLRSGLFAPLVFQGRTLGMLTLTSTQPNYFTQQRATFVSAFANFAAAALENTQALAQAVKSAALEERSRLARELHDSVSQALFGIVLGTRTAIHRVTENQPQEAEDPMKYVLALAEAALAEMRALIFELRPESLEQQGLVTAFRKQAEALCARHKIDVRIDFDAREPNLPIQLKEALYRVALEAIQNTIKHAQATRVDLSLQQTAETVHLEVRDNGLGFDAGREYVGHYGLHTMRERVVKYGGEVAIDSKLGEGTCVKVWVPISQKKNFRQMMCCWLKRFDRQHRAHNMGRRIPAKRTTSARSAILRPQFFRRLMAFRARVHRDSSGESTISPRGARGDGAFSSKNTAKYTAKSS